MTRPSAGSQGRLLPTARQAFRMPPLYPISDRRLAGGITHPQIAREAARGGATLMQVREKELPDAELLEQLRGCVRQGGPGIIVNDRPDLAVASGAMGVHLGAGDLPPAEARKILGAEAIIGVSTHSVAEAIEACIPEIDYVALGPIYLSGTKISDRRPLGPEAVAGVAGRISLPLVAIGGITVERAPALWAAGAAGVAVISGVMAPGGIEAGVRAFLERAGA